MKRILAGLALTTAAALATGTPAQAATVNPVKALQKQFVAGHGVRIIESSRTTMNGKSTGTAKASATFVFGKSGIAASDVKNSNPAIKDVLSPTRAVTVGGHSYVQGGVFSQDLPDGKKWVRYPGMASGVTYNQMIDVFNPAVVKLLVSKAKSVKGNLYRGSLTQDELSKASHTAKLGGELGKTKIDYALLVNSKGLASNLKSTWTMDFGLLGAYKSSTETKYIGWGSKVTIKAPAKDQWVDVDDLGADSEVPEQLKESSISSIGSE